MNISDITRSPRIICAVCAAVLIFQGCAVAPPRNNPLPGPLAEQAEVRGIPEARAWADEAPKSIEYWLEEAPEEEIRAEFGGVMDREHVYLAISEGGAGGAFGAGLLKGWSESGTAPNSRWSPESVLVVSLHRSRSWDQPMTRN